MKILSAFSSVSGPTFTRKTVPSASGTCIRDQQLGVFLIFNNYPDPPFFLAFFDFLAFFVFRFSLLFLAFFLPFPRISGVPRREKPLHFWGKNPCFFQKSKGWRVRVKTTPTPNKNGSYGIQGGVRMPYFGVRMPYFLQKSLDFNRLYAIRTPWYGIFWGHIFCKYGGWGWSELFS